MFERLVQDAPLFFSASNMLFLLQAAGRTLLMTLVGCGVGMIFGLAIAVLRQSQLALLAPLRALAILYVETFRRIPFLVILFIVLFVIEPALPGASVFAIATIPQ